MVQEYLGWQHLAKHDICFLFAPGDKELLWHVVPSKINLKVRGPYVFIRNMGLLQVIACIKNLDDMEEDPHH